MFLSHWFELSGFDKVMAPIPSPDSKVEGSSSKTPEKNENGVVHNNALITAAMNDEEENPFWSIVAPRQKPSMVKNNGTNGNDVHDNSEDEAREEEQTVTKAPPAEMFRQQQHSGAIQCMHCHKMTPINSKVSDDEEENSEQQKQEQQQLLVLQKTLQEREQALKNATQARRELEEKMEKMRLELEVLRMKIDDNGGSSGGGSTAQDAETNSWQPTTPATNNGVATAITTSAAATTSFQTNSDTSLSSLLLSHQPADEPIDEATYIKTQVLAAATDTADTLTSPIFIWEKRKNIFERCSAAPKKKPQKKKNVTQQVGDGEEYSVNLKKLIKDFKKYPGLVNIRSANMPPLPDGYTVLHAAVHGGNVEVVEYLIQEYVLVDPNDDDDSRPILDLNGRDLQGRTALHICAEMGHTEILPLLERAYEMENMAQIKKEEEKDDVDDDEGQLSNAMDKLDTLSITTTPTTPAQQPRTTRSKSRQKSRSPKPSSSSHLSLKFAGSAAPVDLSGRTPLGYAATSPVPKAKNNRAQLERMLYMSGDRSIVGERTPPRERSGGLFTPPRGESGRKVGFHKNNDGISNDGGESSGNVGGVAVGGSGLTSYLSPTPRKKTAGRKATPFHTSVPSAMKTVPEETVANTVAWGAAEMPGKRIEMEDAILCQYPLDAPPKPLSIGEQKSPSSSAIVSTMGIFGVFDGHGDGGFASQFISSNLISKLQSNPSWNVAYHEFNLSSESCTTDTVETIFTEACYDLDDDLKNEESKPRDGGSTAIVALVSSRKILVANIGDSRCILVKKRTTANNQDGGEESNEMSQIEVIPMSEDHKPDLPDERARIESAGLEVHTDQIPPKEDDENGQYEMISKVKKSDREMLGVARAFGDYDYKSNEDLSSSRQAVVCTPDIVVRDRVDSDDMFLILACDGVWDVMSNNEVGLFVTRGINAATAALAKEDQPADADVLASVGDGLLAECLEKGSTDNMSVLIVALPASGLSFFGNASVTARALAFE